MNSERIGRGRLLRSWLQCSSLGQEFPFAFCPVADILMPDLFSVISLSED